ncbi:MAG: radical SAM protein [Ruminiclostridium sp.]
MATVVDMQWRKKEAGLQDIIKKYPTVSPFIIIQIDVQRRGLFYTDRALEKLDTSIHKVSHSKNSQGEDRITPASLLLRDGTSVIVEESSTQTHREPYTVDVVDNKLVLVDDGNVIEEVEYWEKPKYFDKFTSRGTPMREVIEARPQRFSVAMSHYCHFWTVPGQGCKYCGIGASGVKYKGLENERINRQDLEETMKELIKEKGRFVGVILTGGSILSGKNLCDDELEGYIEALQSIGTVIGTKKFPSQVNSTALSEKQLIRLYEETGLTSYSTDLEAFDEDIYKWVCPGKAAHISFDEWKNRLYEAVDIFGKGYVNTGIVSGVELATPYGFKTEEEALKVDLNLAEELASHGVGLKHDVWHVVPGSIFFQQTTPSLDYYVQLTKGFYDILRKYDIRTEMDSYRKCGMHPNINLDRI